MIRDCEGKKRHATKAAALGHYEWMMEKGVGGSEGMHAYHCRECGGWHLGHRQGSSERRQYLRILDPSRADRRLARRNLRLVASDFSAH
jgi:hypothetical protein